MKAVVRCTFWTNMLELATEIMEMHMDFNGDILINFDFRFRVEEYDLPFTDVDENDACFEAVAFMYENGLMAGNGDGYLAATDAATRADVAYAFMTMLQLYN